jgi:hypothetical protein
LRSFSFAMGLSLIIYKCWLILEIMSTHSFLSFPLPWDCLSSFKSAGYSAKV